MTTLKSNAIFLTAIAISSMAVATETDGRPNQNVVVQVDILKDSKVPICTKKSLNALTETNNHEGLLIAEELASECNQFIILAMGNMAKWVEHRPIRYCLGSIAGEPANAKLLRQLRHMGHDPHSCKGSVDNDVSVVRTVQEPGPAPLNLSIDKIFATTRNMVGVQITYLCGALCGSTEEVILMRQPTGSFKMQSRKALVMY